MAFLEIARLEKSFGPLRVVRDFNLSVEQGEFISLLGPSGCGKTTVLRMVAGFETPDSGAIQIEGRNVVRQRPNARKIGMVFQAYALFPNLTVAQNVGFGLKVAGVPRREAEERVAEMLALIGLPDLGARYPFQLSGGQQQRVALARALAVRPRVLLLDEPLSALDAKIRVSLRTEIRTIQQRLGITTIFVTHDQEEALSMSDRIVVMNGGIAEQVGTPFEIYNQPTTKFVANFVGTISTLVAEVEDPAGGAVRVAGQTIRLPRPVEAPRGGRIGLALRPEALHLGAGDGRDTMLPATIADVQFLGSVIRLQLHTGGTTVALDTFNRPDMPPPRVGEHTQVSFAARDVIVLDS
ncbi:ABC transporter ATP-binding protein [Cereibacter johrii]|uniref:Spermidine/putrescine transport system ATP-binding protein n=1 Tax=Cereibacter johrii TaxID=445629 RepID=A0ABX5JAW7_9RHOB|nr:ATP-binding cassette domain-containing protein [Cereibacter johrii]ODM41692.1 spermidine/putrescine ABC transporter ATP-binding protein [Cereibacter johrii]PTM80596.1 putative spermidine/putrescine transport system ATP-binding protein [Cereibacter johrii]